MYKFRTGPDATDSAPPAADEATSESHAIAGHEAYWTSALERLEPALLPATRKENPGRDRSPQYAGLSLAIPDEIWNILADSSMEPAEVLQAAFIAHVARIGGRHSFDIGYSDAHLAAIVAATPGVYAPVVPMSLTVSPDRAFAGLVAEVARARGAATQHLTFALNLRTRHPGLPEEAQSAVDRIARTAVQVVSDIRTYEPTPGGELTLVVAPGSTAFVLRYDRQVFDNERIQRMAAHLLTLIGSAAREPLRPVSELTLVSGHERHRLLEQWNDTRIEYPHDRTVTTLFEAQAAATPDATAVTDGQTSQSYAQLNAQANRVARHLRRHGVTPGMVVGICMDRSPAMIVALLGILKAGGAYVPLDPAFPADRLAFMVTDSRAPLLVTQKPLEAMLPSHAAKVVLLDLHWPQIAEEDETNPEWTVDTSGLAYVLYTSGSTGTPKGVEIPHRALTNFLCSMQVSPGFGAGDSLLALTTLSFDIAGLELYLPLISGGRVELASREVAMDPRQLAARIEQCRPTMMQATPSTWQMLLESGWNGSRALVALCGGEALPRQLADKLVARTSALWNMYGPTETTVWSSIHRVRATDEEISIGRPIANTGLYILDPHLQLSPIGASGELFIDGDGLALGYRNRPDLTADRFIAHPFSTSPGARLYRTGDLARYREDGSVVHLGRLDFQVKVRGYRIELGEIEAVLAAHPSAAQAVVTARDDDSGATSLVAYVVPAAGGITVASDLRAHLQASLPDYMIPQYFVTLPAMPLTPNGKIDRKRLPTPERSRPLLPVDFEPASNTTQSDLAAIWESVLAVRPVGIDDNFFELGGTSLLAVRMLERIERSLGFRISIGRAFASPTVRGLEALLKDPLPARSSLRAGQGSGSEDIAIVGMAGRFPGCRDTREYWQAISEGRELITFFEEAEIDPSIDRESLRQPNYVKARGVIDEADCFDAAFFGMNPKEADVIDPQQRVLLEVAWHALEDAGIHGAALEQQRVAVFAGVGENAYYRRNLLGNPVVKDHGEFRLRIANEKDYVATRIAYAIGLQGPAVSVQTACSTSLVAVSMAMQSLRAGECEVALCGGASIPVPQNSGHEYNEGSAYSRDGHCRPYDAAASGTVFSSGAGMVVLMRRELAIAEGRRIYAILKGSGVNNDGGGKMSFMAPSVEGQARVLAQALDDAGIGADEVTYIEGHGTATPLGDPIEAEALATVYGDPSRPTYLGSVKGNIGHTDAAAGIAGLIKTALALHHRQLPPSINFTSANPRIPLKSIGVEIVSQLRPWPTDRALCAAVTSLGVGGTNAHVILAAEGSTGSTSAGAGLDSQSPAGLQSESRAESELRSEPEPGYQVQAREEQQPQLLLFSGKSEIAATMLNDRVLARIVTDASLPPAAATTLAHHRRHFKHRRFQVVNPNGVPTDQPAGSGEARTGRALAFLFPGQGAQYPRMGQSLYRDHPAFRSTLDRCAEVLVPELGCDLRDLLFRPTDEADDRLNQTRYTQPLLFVLAVSLSDLWRSRGVRPDALVGHSIGEYAAASIAGVMTLDDALRLVAARGRMMHALPSGAMLSVSLAADELAPLLENGLAIAAVNGPRSCVASGGHGAIAALRQLMMDRGIQCSLLRTSHAFHSPMMDPVLTAFEAEVAKVRLQAPRVPIISTVTAKWLTDEEATSPGYWSRQLRLPVRFAEAIEALWKDKDYVALELGPRATATTLARRMSTDRSAQVAVPSLSSEPGLEQAALLGATGQLWALGLAVDLRAVAPKGPPVELPGYPFTRERHWIEPASHEARDLAGIKALLQAQGTVLREQVALLEQRVAAQGTATASTEVAE